MIAALQHAEAGRIAEEVGSYGVSNHQGQPSPGHELACLVVDQPRMTPGLFFHVR